MKIKLHRDIALSLIAILCAVSCIKFRKYDLPERKNEASTIIETKDILMPANEKTETGYENLVSDQIDLASDEVKQMTDVTQKLPISFPVGEKISYDVKLQNVKSPFGFDNGNVTFEIDKGTLDNRDCYIFRGTAEGGGFGYKLRLASESYIDSNSFRPLLFTNTQSGSERRRKKLVFFDDKIEYVKLKHCKIGDTCQVEAHFIEENGVKIHCKKCKDTDHYTWKVRAVHKMDKPTYDLLSALFIARNFPLHVGGKGREITLVEGRDLWKMRFQAIGEEVIETKIGKFNTMSLKLTAMPLNDHAKKKKTFRGLFGLKGDIGLWVDKKSKIPIRIRGAYPLIFDVPIEILIKSIEGNNILVPSPLMGEG